MSVSECAVGRERPQVDVLVVVVTHDSEKELPALLVSLEPGLVGIGSWHLVVVDTNSRDSTCALVRNLAPHATLLELPTNVGYGAAVNAAVAGGPGSRAVFILNADVCLHEGCARRLLGAVGPGVGVVVPRLLDNAGQLALSLRRAPTIARALAEAMMGGERASRIALGEVVANGARYRRPGTVDWATGAAWLVTSECFAELGGFDESFFLYSEETDFALRARARGYTVRAVPNAVANHSGGASGTDPALFSLLVRNRVACYRRRHGRVATLAFRAVLLAGQLARAGRPTSRAAARALLGSRRVLPVDYRMVRIHAHRPGRSLDAAALRRSDP